LAGQALLLLLRSVQVHLLHLLMDLLD